MSSISANYGVRNLDPGQVGQTSGADQSGKTGDKNLTVSLTIGGTTDVAGPIAITLSYPLIGPEDVHLNELMQQLEGLDMSQFQGLSLADTVSRIDQAIIGIAEALEKTSKEFFKENSGQIANIFGQIEQMADNIATSLYDIITNSSYPDFTDFLKSMLESALQIRKAASDVRTAAIKGEFENTLAQASKMKEAAVERYNQRMEEIKGKEAEAWAQLAGALCSMAISAGGAKIGGFDGMQAVNGFSTGASQMGSAIGSLISASHQRTAAEHEKNAAMLDAKVKELEATNKMFQEGQNVAQELKELAKQLIDMALKMIQDFESSRNQIIQRGNI